MGFMLLPPTKWEIEHAAGIFKGLVYQKLHDGDLPDTPIWDRLERRFDLNATRFTHFHPNIAAMIVDSRREQGGPTIEVPCEPPIIVTPPSCPIVCVPSTSPPAPDPGPTGPQIVPEPASYILMGFAVVLIYMRRKSFV